MPLKSSDSLRFKKILHNPREIIKTRRLLIILIIIFILISSIAISFIITKSKDAGTLSAMITVDNSQARVGEQINFNSDKCEGDIHRFHWTFGDGLVSNESNPIHSYETAGWYNVTLYIFDNNGNQINTSISVGIQQNDETRNLQIGSQRNLRPGGIFGNSQFAQIGPNIGNPTIELSLRINNPVGEFEIVVQIVIWRSEDDGEFIEIHSETRTTTGTDITFTYSLEPSSIPNDVQFYNTDIWLGIIGQVGRWESGEIVIITEYPLNIETEE